MKHICHDAGESTKTPVLHCDSVASRGMAQTAGCWEMPPHRGEMAVETRSDRVKHCRHGDEGVDERQNTETDEPDGNGFGCWGGVSCAAANGDKPRGRRFLTVA